MADMDHAVETDSAVLQEMRRIRATLKPSDGDKEDLISYAKEVVRLRVALRATEQAAPVAHVWPAPGDKMQFLDRNGYEFQLEEARKTFTKGQVLTVKSIDILSFDHFIQFEECPSRRWNGVMFALTSPAQNG